VFAREAMRPRLFALRVMVPADAFERPHDAGNCLDTEGDCMVAFSISEEVQWLAVGLETFHHKLNLL